MHLRHLLLTSALLVFAHPVMAADLCEGGPRDQWLAKEAISELVVNMGYSTADYMLMIEDGCLEAKVVHEGKRIEIYFEPITGEVVKIKED